jgi:protein gp37
MAGLDLPNYHAHWPLPNIWLGITAENQQAFEERAPWLRKCPAAIRFVSLEPLLGPIIMDDLLTGIDWCIVGGETGPGARPMHPEWVRNIRDQCQSAGVPFFFKQWGEWGPAWEHGLRGEPDALMRRVGKKAAGRMLDGRTWDEVPNLK